MNTNKKQLNKKNITIISLLSLGAIIGCSIYFFDKHIKKKHNDYIDYYEDFE